MLPLVASLTASSTVFLFTMWYVRSKNQHETRLRSLLEPQRLIAEQQDPFTQRVAFPVVNGLVNFLMAVLPTSLIGRARKWLVTAGDKLSLPQFLTIVLIAMTALPATFFVLTWMAANGPPDPRVFLVLPVLGIIGLGVPFLILRRLAKNRQKAIWRAMPNALDLLTTCVEAGLSLDFGLQRVSERYNGPLSDEINRALREMGLVLDLMPGEKKKITQGDLDRLAEGQPPRSL